MRETVAPSELSRTGPVPVRVCSTIVIAFSRGSDVETWPEPSDHCHKFFRARKIFRKRPEEKKQSAGGGLGVTSAQLSRAGSAAVPSAARASAASSTSSSFVNSAPRAVGGGNSAISVARSSGTCQLILWLASAV